MKVCTACRESLPLEAFTRDSRRKDGRQSRCKSCRSVSRNYRAEAATRHAYQREYKRKWRADNPELAREQWRKYARTDYLTVWRKGER